MIAIVDINGVTIGNLLLTTRAWLVLIYKDCT